MSEQRCLRRLRRCLGDEGDCLFGFAIAGTAILPVTIDRKNFNVRGSTFLVSKAFRVERRGRFCLLRRNHRRIEGAAKNHRPRVAQVRNYLHVSELELGLILNFGKKKLQHRRVEPNRTEREDED